MTAATMQRAAPGYRSPLVMSAVGHVILAVLLSTSLVFMPDAPFEQLAIEAVVVDEAALKRAAEQERRAEQEAAQRREAEQLELRQRQEQERQQELAAQRKADAAAREKRAEQQKREQAEQQRRAAEAKAAEVKAAEAAERKRQEAERAAERAKQQAAEKKAAEARAKAAAEQREQQRRQAELAAALEEEEALFAARQSGAMNVYKSLIQQQVQRNWQQPASAVAGVECEVFVRQLPNGDVIEARVTKCNGDEAVRMSVERAVRAASPLPLPDDPRLFERNLTFSFRPQINN